MYPYFIILTVTEKTDEYPSNLHINQNRFNFVQKEVAMNTSRNMSDSGSRLGFLALMVICILSFILFSSAEKEEENYFTRDTTQEVRDI